MREQSEINDERARQMCRLRVPFFGAALNARKHNEAKTKQKSAEGDQEDNEDDARMPRFIGPYYPCEWSSLPDKFYCHLKLKTNLLLDSQPDRKSASH